MNRTVHKPTGKTALLACAAALFLAIFAGCAETPQSAYEKIIEHGENGQFGKVWDRIDKKSQAKLEMGLELLAGLGAMGAAASGDTQKAEELKSLKGKDLFVKVCQEVDQARESYVKRRVKSVKTEGDRATLTVVATGGGGDKEETVHMVKEDGIWKLSMER